MKTAMRVLVAVMALMAVLQVALATDVRTGLTPTVTTEKFVPSVWMCNGARHTADDGWQSARCNTKLDLSQREWNYAFEGEQVSWPILVLEKNGIEKIKDVYVVVGDSTSANPSDIQANCVLDRILEDGTPLTGESHPKLACFDARLGEEVFTTVPGDNVMAVYTCTLTVESTQSMHGEYWIMPVAEDLDGNLGVADEKEYWFFNPTVALAINGAIDFGEVRPGASAYSTTLTIGNDAEQGSGVMMEMFIGGTDFTDPSNSGAKCPDSNVLKLANFRYYATAGAYSSATNPGVDPEKYDAIPYADELKEAQEIIGGELYTVCGTPYDAGNVLSPGSEMSLTFKLNLPLPCNGDFSDGNIYFWGEAV